MGQKLPYESRTEVPHVPRAYFRTLEFVSQAFSTYFLVIFKNVIGWLLMISALPVGIALPGPGGLPMFIIGFALVTFPGKRKLTTRVMSGRGLPLQAQVFTILTALISIGLTVGLMWFIGDRYERLFAFFHLYIKGNNAGYIALIGALFGLGLLAMIVTWAVTRTALQVFNYVLRGIPWIRRRMRPWLKKKGFTFLPSRRKRHVGSTIIDREILEIDERHQTRFREAWAFFKPWLRRMFGLGVTVCIFGLMIRPLVKRWPLVQNRIDQLSVSRFLLAALMFALFLFLFRAMSWRRVLTAFGHKLPIAAATRIWSTSELARYLPGAIWQVWGRIYLIKPYGVSGTITSTSQILELCIFLLANVLVAATCLLWYVSKIAPGARLWLYIAMALVPTLTLLLHPNVFYGIVNFICKKIRKPPIVQRLRGSSLVKLLGWMIIGLMWQSLAVFLIVQPALNLKIDWWWVVAGAYCLAWCAGFLAILAPGGLGPRELVFVLTMQLVLPNAARAQFADNAQLDAMLIFLGFLLRLWTIIGEIIVVSISHAADFHAALGRADAPGRIGRVVAGLE